MLYLGTSLQAEVIKVGKYRFDLTIKNSFEKELQSVQYNIDLQLQPSHALVHIVSRGYRTQDFEIQLNPGQRRYSETVVLEEPPFNVNVLDFSGNHPIHAKVQLLPGTVAADQYRMLIKVTEPGYTEFNWWDLTVKNHGFEIGWAKVVVKQTGKGRYIDVLIPRLFVWDDGNNIEIIVPSDDLQPVSSNKNPKAQAFKKLYRIQAETAH